MEQNVAIQAYPVFEDKQNRELMQQYQYPQEQNNIPVGYPNQQYIPTQQQQPYINPQQVIIQPVVIQQVRRSNAEGCSYPADILCPYCQKPVQTIIEYKSGCSTWLACLLLLFLFLPLFFLPFCFRDCQDKIHKCPNCGKKVGKKKYKLCC